MGYYDSDGVGALMDDKGPFEIITPNRVLTEMRSIDSDVGSLSRDIQASQVSPDFKASYGLFATEWRAFYDDYTGSPIAWAGRAQNSVIRKVDEYRRTIDEWRKGFEKLGGIVTAADRPKSKSFPWGWAIAVAGLGLLAYKAFGPSDEVVRFKVSK